MAVEYVGTGNDDGVVFGRSGDKIGFYGLATPIVKPTITITVTAAGPVTACATDINAIKAGLVALGLVA